MLIPNELIYALAQITTHIEKSLSEEEIIQTLRTELSKIDLSCILAIFDNGHRLSTICSPSVEAEAPEPEASGTSFPLIKYTFSSKKLNSMLRGDRHLGGTHTPEHEINSSSDQPGEEEGSDLFQEIGIEPDTEPLRLPLTFEEKPLGLLWIWGEGLTEADLPVMLIFAKQIATSLERTRLFQEVQSLALTDPLTGLHNRRSLFELGRIEFSRAHRLQRPFSCMMLDLDHFKQINDSYGHLIGDHVLQEFANLCKSSVREVDLIGRYGGEELVILLPETDSEAAMQVAERLRATIVDQPITVSDQTLHITASIGVSGKDENTLDLETLIARADQALYIAKHKGRNQVAISK